MKKSAHQKVQESDKQAKKISVERGSAVSRRLSNINKNTSNETTQVAQKFLTHNKKGDTRVFVAGGSREGCGELYTEQAFLLGQEIGQRNYRLDFGLASSGIMGSVARGVLNGWAKEGHKEQSPIHGVTTKEYLALYQSDEVLDEVCDIIVAHTLEERKQQLLSADFVIFCPGGVGTLDELAYDCVAIQDGFLDFKPFILFNVESFFYHLLEYLKEIQIKGFSNPVPFIVVDDAFEAGIAFDMLQLIYEKHIKTYKPFDVIEYIIYLLPYVINQKRQHPEMETATILNEMRSKHENGSDTERQEIEAAVEASYLRKEIERMYERLAKAGKDTALVSDKLSELKERSKKGLRFHGIY